MLKAGKTLCTITLMLAIFLVVAITSPRTPDALSLHTVQSMVLGGMTGRVMTTIAILFLIGLVLTVVGACGDRRTAGPDLDADGIR